MYGSVWYTSTEHTWQLRAIYVNERTYKFMLSLSLTLCKLLESVLLFSSQDSSGSNAKESNEGSRTFYPIPPAPTQNPGWGRKVEKETENKKAKASLKENEGRQVALEAWVCDSEGLIKAWKVSATAMYVTCLTPVPKRIMGSGITEGLWKTVTLVAPSKPCLLGFMPLSALPQWCHWCHVMCFRQWDISLPFA